MVMYHKMTHNPSLDLENHKMEYAPLLERVHDTISG